jgi:hypothetical protein
LPDGAGSATIRVLMASRMLKLRRPDVCVACGCALPAGAEAWWDAGTRTVTCAGCRGTAAEPALPELDRGRAGASVAREHARRRSNRERRTRDAHPVIGGLLLALRSGPQHETAFRRGELGVRAVAAALERRTAKGPAVVLHDRRMPRGRGNIDHLAVAPSGVFVVDAKHHAGKVRVVDHVSGASELRIDRRDRTTLVAGLDRQVSAVLAALAAGGHPDVPVQGVLCFTTADLPLLRTLKIRGHLLLHPGALARRLNADGPRSPAAIEALARTLAAALPPA